MKITQKTNIGKRNLKEHEEMRKQKEMLKKPFRCTNLILFFLIYTSKKARQTIKRKNEHLNKEGRNAKMNTTRKKSVNTQRETLRKKNCPPLGRKKGFSFSKENKRKEPKLKTGGFRAK